MRWNGMNDCWGEKKKHNNFTFKRTFKRGQTHPIYWIWHTVCDIYISKCLYKRRKKKNKEMFNEITVEKKSEKMNQNRHRNIESDDNDERNSLRNRKNDIKMAHKLTYSNGFGSYEYGTVVQMMAV